MPGISYDEQGALAGYFGVTTLAVVLIPATYFVFKPAKKEPLQPLCTCAECRANFSRIDARKSAAHSKRFTRRFLPLLAGWLLFAYLAWTIAKAPRGEGTVVYNPFEILGLGSQSTDKQIKKHYKKLSLQFHPDKIKLSENQTMEDAESHFVEITKAYKSLTDEVTRENLAKYGNPDGPQQREDKIAIPQWVVEGKNSFWVLGAYGLFLGGGLPYVVGRWWFSQRRHTRDGILTSTAEHFFYNLRDDTDFSTLLTILAGASEFAALLAASTGRKLSKKDKKAKQAKVEELEKVLEKRKEALVIDEENPCIREESKVGVTTAPARRAKALLWAHLLHVEVEDEEMRNELDALLRGAQPVLNALLNISLAHSWLAASQTCIKMQAALVQALPPSVSPLAQLPGFSPEKAEEEMVVKSAEGKRWLEKWVKKSDGVSGKEDALVGSELKSALRAAKTWPRLEIVSAEFKVEGEKVVPPSSIVSLVFKARYVYPTTSNSTAPAAASSVKAELTNGDSHEANGDAKPDVSAAAENVAGDGQDTAEKVADSVKDETKDIKEKLEDVKEGVQDVVASVKEKAVQVGRKGKEAGLLAEKNKVWTPTGYAHAPHWPLHRKPHFQVLLGDSKLDKVIVPPTKITDIPLPRADGLPSEPREYTLQFPAPPQANLYSFVLYALSDTYFGADVDKPMMMKVEDPPADASDDEDGDDADDISEPDEDSLAGQMAMMRGGKVKPSAVHGDDDGESGDEDGSEYESSSDEEGPANRRKKAINEDSDSDSD